MAGYLEKVETVSQSFDAYKELTPKLWRDCLRLAKKIQGKRIIHINSTYLGGGVAELLRTQIPLENSLGLKSQWFVIKAPEKFFEITKKIHNLLQGKKGSLNKLEKKFYLEWINKKIAPLFKDLLLKEKPDLVIIHDPQPLPLVEFFSRGIVPVLRLHIDLSAPCQSILSFFQPFIEKYRLVILTSSVYRPIWLSRKKVRIIQPAINPFSEKNKFIKLSQAKEILFHFDVNPSQPIVAQVSRFDPWKDPLGVIQAYYLAKNQFPSLQLLLVGFFQAADDPEAKEVFKKVEKHARGDSDIFLFADPSVLRDISNDLFVNAVYTASSVILQKSIKEGFGITVTEAMWKGKPVIGGRTTGIALQITHNQNGFLVSSPEEAGKYLIELLKSKSLRERIGQAAHQTVKEKFLFPRLILDHLRLYQELDLR